MDIKTHLEEIKNRVESLKEYYHYNLANTDDWILESAYSFIPDKIEALEKWVNECIAHINGKENVL